MAYNYNIPLATDQLSISQGDILGNFTALGAIAGNPTANSASLNATVGFNFVNFAQQSANPATGANQMALYTGVNGNSGVQEMYIQRENTSETTPFTAGVLEPSGWSYFPSGLIMTWGTGTIGGGGTVTITYTTNSATFPGFDDYVFGVFPVATTATALTLTTYLAPLTSFVMTGTPAATFTWVAIGF